MIDARSIPGFDPDVQGCLVSTVEGLGVTNATEPVVIAHEGVGEPDDQLDVVVMLTGFVQVSIVWRDSVGTPLELPTLLTLLDDPTAAQFVLIKLYNAWAQMANQSEGDGLPLLAELAASIACAICAARDVAIELIARELRTRDAIAASDADPSLTASDLADQYGVTLDDTIELDGF